MTLIYMVEMALRAGEPEAEWHRWYDAHIAKLLAVPGFRASQRFQSVRPVPAPFVALHEVEEGVHDGAAYRAVGGPSNTGVWQHRMPNWRRNLLAGLKETPEVPEGSFLLVIDDPRRTEAPVAWLEAVGLDRSPATRGLGVVADLEPWTELAARDAAVRLFRPISPKLRSMDAGRSAT